MLYAFAFGGVLLALVFGFSGNLHDQWYGVVIAGLLATGLYSNTYGISISEARAHIRLIISAITIGVCAKALIIGTIMAIVLKDPFGFVLGVAVAQIDPLSTAALQQGKRLSAKAKTILNAWASFDDPITVILAISMPAILTMITGDQWPALSGSVHNAGFMGYLVNAGLNVALAGGIFICWLTIKRYARAQSATAVSLAMVGMYGILIVSFSIAITHFWMIGIALIGLFLRPPIQKIIDRTVQWALCMAALLLGVLLVNGIAISAGITLGLAAFSAQIIVGYTLTRHLARRDRLHIAFAQQNGITAIILALLFEPHYPGTIALVGPAILVTNMLHFTTNKLLDAHLAKKSLRPFSLPAHIKKMRAHMAKI